MQLVKIYIQIMKNLYEKWEKSDIDAGIAYNISKVKTNIRYECNECKIF